VPWRRLGDGSHVDLLATPVEAGLLQFAEVIPILRDSVKLTAY
jgi:hypothetical protein